MGGIKKTVIFFSYTCNNRCVFCINANKRDIPGPSLEGIKKGIAAARRRGSTYLELIGGEPTIYPRIQELIQYARDVGFKTIMIATNGRMLAYPDFARGLLRAGLNSIVFSIHGHTARLHDSLTQVPGSFAQLRKGIENIKRIAKECRGGVSLGTNTTIVRQNYKHLPRIGEYIWKLGLKNAEFIFVDPNYGGAHDNFMELVPKISDMAPYARKCLDIGIRHNITHWHIRYVPLCHFTGYLDRISELYEVQTYRNVEHVAPDFYNPRALENRKTVGRIKPAKCRPCALFNQCEGIWKEYARRYGVAELIPQKHARSAAGK